MRGETIPRFFTPSAELGERRSTALAVKKEWGGYGDDTDCFKALDEWKKAVRRVARRVSQDAKLNATCKTRAIQTLTEAVGLLQACDGRRQDAARIAVILAAHPDLEPLVPVQPSGRRCSQALFAHVNRSLDSGFVRDAEACMANDGGKPPTLDVPLSFVPGDDRGKHTPISRLREKLPFMRDRLTKLRSSHNDEPTDIPQVIGDVTVGYYSGV